MAADIKILIAAQDNASSVLAKVRGSLDGMRSSAAFAALGVGGLAGAFSGLTAISLIKGATDGADALNDMADRTGVAASALSELDYAAKMNGTTLENVETALKRVSVKATEAATGSKQAATMFDALGVSVMDASGGLKSSDTLLQDVADVLNKVEDRTLRTALAVEIFGKSGAEMIPLMENMRKSREEAQRLGVVVSDDFAKQAGEFNDNMDRMGAVSSGFAKTLANEVLPALNWVMKAMFGKGDSAEDELTRVARMIDLKQQGLTAVAPDTRAAKVLREELDALRDRKNILQGIAMLDQNYRSRAQSAPVDGKDILGKLKAANEKDTKSGKASKGPDPDADYKSYLSNLQNQADSVRHLSAEAKLLLDIERGRLIVSDAQRKTLLDEAKKIDQQKEQVRLHQEAVQHLEETERAMERIYGDTSKITTQVDAEREHVKQIGMTATAIADVVAAKMEDEAATLGRRALLMDDIDLSGQLGDQLRKQAQGLRDIAQLKRQGAAKEEGVKLQEDAKKASEEFAKELHGDLKGAFSAAFRDSSGQPLKAFGDALENVVFTRAATALADSLATAVAQDMGASLVKGGGGDLLKQAGSWLGGMLSFDGGGYTGTGSRSGGLDGKGGFMAMLHPDETVVDHSKGQSMAQGNVTVSIVNHIDSRSDMATILAISRQSEERVKSEILRSRQRGGAFA